MNQMRKLGMLFGLLGVLGLCLFLMLRDEPSGGSSVRKLEMYCAAGLQKPVEEIARQYEEEYGVKIMLNFGGSGQLLARLEVAGGDLYLPADVSYVDKAMKLQIVADFMLVGDLTAGIIVAKGNPKNIETLQDFTRDDVKVVIAERSAGVGEFTHRALENAGLLETVENGVFSKVSTVNEVALQVGLGASDAGVVWDALMPQFKQCEFVRVPVFEKNQSQAAICILKRSENRAEALKFARYLRAKNKGAVVFRKHGFDVQAGDQWVE